MLLFSCRHQHTHATVILETSHYRPLVDYIGAEFFPFVVVFFLEEAAVLDVTGT